LTSSKNFATTTPNGLAGIWSRWRTAKIRAASSGLERLSSMRRESHKWRFSGKSAAFFAFPPQSFSLSRILIGKKSPLPTVFRGKEGGGLLPHTYYQHAETDIAS
jgi:hypothetical protein